MMYIEIAGLIFKCAEDENIFMSRLYELQSIDSVVSKGANVYLTLNNLFNDAVLEEVQIICDIWGSTFKFIKDDVLEL